METGFFSSNTHWEKIEILFLNFNRMKCKTTKLLSWIFEDRIIYCIIPKIITSVHIVFGRYREEISVKAYWGLNMMQKCF